MIVAVPSVLPGGSLSPSQAAARFNVQQLAGMRGLRGLGDMICEATDDAGNCTYAEDPNVPGSGTSIAPMAQTYSTTTDPFLGQTPEISYQPNPSSAAATDSAKASTPRVVASSGVTCGSGTANVNGKCVQYPSGSSSTDAAIAAAIKGGLDITKLLVIQPGTVQQGNTTIRQTTGYAVSAPVTSTGVSGTLTTSSSTILLLAAAAFAALMFMGKAKGA